jgi:hypothetical protein
MEDMNLRSDESHDRPASQSALVTTAVIAFAFLCLAVVGLYYATRYRGQVNNLTAQNDQTTASLSQARSQLDELSLKVASLSAQPPATATSATEPAKSEDMTAAAPTPKSAHRAAKHVKRDDPRWKQLQDQLAEHQKEIDAEHQDVDKNRTDLEGEITQSHDELNGTIAKNHDELVALEKRGQRDFTEFDLNKSKDFHRVGPLSIAVRKVNIKHDFADLEILIDDNRIQKKHVNLLEPVMLYPANYVASVEIVLNHLDKNRAGGYISVPKFKQSELSTEGTSNNTLTPATGAAQPGASLVSRPAQQP